METHARYVVVGLCTFIALAAGFLFVFWLHNSGGGGAQALYRIRFEAPVIGLRPGISVLFNGLRVGEVRRVDLDPSDPKVLSAEIAVDASAPVREDTHVGVDAQGLLGSAVVSLRGGSSALAPKPGPAGEPPLLIADPEASATLGQSAKATLARIDAILDDNAPALRSGIANLNTFSDTLARNSGRVDTILAGLEKTMGGGKPPPPPQTYDLSVPQFPAPDKPLTAQVAVPEPTALVVFETQRALASPKPGERIPLEPGEWSDSLPKVVQAKIAQSFEAAGFAHVAKSMDGFTADFQVVLEIRAFELQLTPDPSAQVDISAKLLGADGKIVAAQDFHASAPASGVDAPAAFAALDQAFGKVAAALVLWAAKTIP